MELEKEHPSSQQYSSSQLFDFSKIIAVIVLVLILTNVYLQNSKIPSAVSQQSTQSTSPKSSLSTGNSNKSSRTTTTSSTTSNITTTTTPLSNSEMAGKIRLPCIFISHGLVGETLDPKRGQRQFFKKFYKDYNLQERVKTIIIISGHWEENTVTVNLNPTPKIVHDHPSEWLFKYNFRFQTDMELAKRIQAKLTEEKFTVNVTKNEDVDHGAWGGIFSLYDIEEQQKAYNNNKGQFVPQIVQVSLHSGMNTQLHYKLGQILGQFQDENTMIICSGATTHSFTYMRHPKYVEWSEDWEKWLIGLITDNDINKRRELFNVKQHRMYSYINHSDEHFMPLLVALGTSDQKPELLYLEKNMLLWGSSYIFK